MPRPFAPAPLLAAALLAAGCGAPRGLPAGSVVDDAPIGPFYAEVPLRKDGKPTNRVLVCATRKFLADYLASGEIPETGHVKFVGKGIGRQTLVVENSDKDIPAMPARLVAEYRHRHGLN